MLLLLLLLLLLLFSLLLLSNIILTSNMMALVGILMTLAGNMSHEAVTGSRLLEYVTISPLPLHEELIAGM